MSKRLDFLTKTRPEAASAYFTFLQESGKYLDDKTRFLLSVSTKVITGTNSGLKQYIPHAIRAGASGNEIIDTILMSFPAAGLKKVLDAFEVIQEMDLPELKLENLDKKPEWHTLIAINDIPNDKPLIKEIKGKRILLYKSGDEIKVYDGLCPHLGNKLPQKGEGSKLTCPVHKWVFDLLTGECIENGKRALHTIPHRIENNELQVKVTLFND